jgi:hypothetical protein
VLWFESEKVEQTNFPKGKHMNIKRAFLALGAMILGVGFFGASPALACTPAFHPTTQQPATSWNQWPVNTHMYWCGTSANDVDANVIKNAATSATNSGASTPAPQPKMKFLFSGNGVGAVDVYAFGNWTDATTYFNINPTLPPGVTAANVRGYTIQPGESSVHPGTAVIIINKVDPVTMQNDHTWNTHATNHEIGHAADITFNRPSQNSGSTFRTTLQTEINTFNGKTTFDWTPYGGLTATCAAKANNFAKLQCKWESDAGSFAELYASAYGAKSPGSIHDQDLVHILNNEFPNTMLYMQNIRKTWPSSP